MKRPAFLLRHLLPLLLLWDAVGCAEDAGKGVVTSDEVVGAPPTPRAEDASHGEVMGPKLGKSGRVTYEGDWSYPASWEVQMRVQRDWTFKLVGYTFGLIEVPPHGSKGDYGMWDWWRPRATIVCCGKWQFAAMGYGAPAVAGGLAVLAGLMVVASGVLIRRRRHEPLPKRGSS